MKLVIMTKSTFFVEEDKILATLFEEEMDNLHLYKPGAAPMYTERLLTLLPEEYYRKITVHDQYYLKQEYDLAGIHLDDPFQELPQGYRGKVSRTCRDLGQLKDIKKKSNYVFLGDILRNTEDPASMGFSMNQLEKAASQGLIDKKVYALGGMTLDNIKIAKDLGFGGVVIEDELWDKFDIQHGADYKNLILHFEKLKKATS